MAWNTIAEPSNLGQRRRSRRLNLNDYGGANSWGASIDSMNMLNQVYRGRFDRLERYRIYDWMDRDTDIARALDIISDHCTEVDDEDYYFQFKFFGEDPTDEETTVLYEHLAQWTRLNHWHKRLNRNVRNVLKYGDWFYFRNPNTFELYNIHPKFVLGALIDRDNMEVVGWVIRNFRFNVENIELSVNDRTMQDQIKNLSTPTGGYRNTRVIPALHIIHLTTSEGKFAGSASDDDPQDRYTNRWPFGESWLEQAYKTFRQRELLEDAAIIHRVQRAPSRIVWYIDTGKMRPDRASWTVQNFKNELNQSRVPTMVGGVGGEKGVDSVYNAISQLEDIYIPVSFDQRGSKVETLEGQPWDNLPDLEYFTEKMMRSLRVPYAWLRPGQSGGIPFSDGRAGVAYQEEIEFSRFCTKLQKNIVEAYDMEFKLYCNMRDVNVNFADFMIIFNPPDNYEDSKNLARANEAIAVFTALEPLGYLSKRKLLKKYLKWDDADIAENERMVMEEKSAMDIDNSDLGGAGAGGAMGMPLGGPMGPGMGAPMGDQNQMGAMPGGMDAGAMGADLGGMAGGMTASPMSPGGMGETKDMKGKNILNEAPLTFDDIKPSERKDQARKEEEVETRTPNDRLFMASDVVKPDAIATVKVIRKIRMAHLARRVERERRMKIIKKVYNQPNPDALGGGLPGL